jgi:threonine/homoserine/homoserine lactone efflux protein
MFIWSAIAHLIALTSPGPDTAVVIRQVSLYGRIEGFKVSIGIGIGIYIHCLLAVNGISIIVLSNVLYKFVISLIGSIYIFYLGISMLFNNTNSSTEIRKDGRYNNSILIGLITNIFNIKAFLFFVSLFTILIDSIDNTFYYIYPIYFALTSTLWFSLLSYLLTISKNKKLNIYSNKYISFTMSLVLCLIGLLIFIKSAYEYF